MTGRRENLASRDEARAIAPLILEANVYASRSGFRRFIDARARPDASHVRPVFIDHRLRDDTARPSPMTLVGGIVTIGQRQEAA
jgi:hypothetical protein